MDRSSAHDPRAIANKILDIRAESGEPITIMQLIKLAYISDGWSLALLGQPLANETAEAWQYGPVFRSIYNAFNGIGARPISNRAYLRGTELPYTEEFSESEDALIRMVVRSYGKLTAYALSNLTHQAGTPWSEAYEKGVYTPIKTADVLNHFRALKEKRLVKREAS